MNLLQNPFYILQASPRDTRQRIMELAEERSLLTDPETCSQARLALTTPKKRLAAEIAWLPGIGPARAGEMLALVESSPWKLFATKNLPPLTRANLLAAGIARVFDGSDENLTPEDITEWVIELAWEFEDIEPESLRTLINEERNIAGFSPVPELQDIETALQEQRQYYRQVIRAALNTLPSRELVEAVTLIVDSATDNGLEPGPVLVADLADLYEIEAQPFLEKEEENISLLVKKLRDTADAKAPDTVLAPIVEQLISVVKNWDTVAQPIQVSMKGRGLDHGASHRVARLVRELSVHLFNKHDKLDFSRQLTDILQEVFAEVGKVADITAEDAGTLERITEERIRLKENEEHPSAAWQKEITCSIPIGFLKQEFSISPEGIQWAGRCWPLESITRVRWWITRYMIKGTQTGGTAYSIAFGDISDYDTVKIFNEENYSRFVDCLWKAVCVRLMTSYLKSLREGKTLHLGYTVVSDTGIKLERPTFFGGKEQVFCRWDELTTWHEEGLFCIGKKDDKKLTASFSYRKTDNTHLFEHLVCTLLQRGGNRLSSLL